MKDKDFEIQFEDAVKENFEAPDKGYILWELEQAIDVTIDEYIDTEDETNRLKESLVRTTQERLILGNQTTMMQALRLLLKEKKDESDNEAT